MNVVIIPSFEHDTRHKWNPYQVFVKNILRLQMPRSKNVLHPGTNLGKNELQP